MHIGKDWFLIFETVPPNGNHAYCKLKLWCLLFCVKHTGNSDVVLNEADVVLCLGWKVVPLPGCRRIRLPTREGLILDLHFVQNVHVGYDWKKLLSVIKQSRWVCESYSHICNFITWEMRNSFSIEFVGDSNFNFIKHIQNVKFCQSNAVGQEHVIRHLLFIIIVIHKGAEINLC